MKMKKGCFHRNDITRLLISCTFSLLYCDTILKIRQLWKRVFSQSIVWFTIAGVSRCVLVHIPQDINPANTMLVKCGSAILWRQFDCNPYGKLSLFQGNLLVC